MERSLDESQDKVSNALNGFEIVLDLKNLNSQETQVTPDKMDENGMKNKKTWLSDIDVYTADIPNRC